MLAVCSWRCAMALCGNASICLKESSLMDVPRGSFFFLSPFSALLRERGIVLTSGDVLVFGGESRLVYHGTRDLRPGTRPENLKMCSGRLNFTFRQHDPPGFVPPSLERSTPASKLVPLKQYFQ